MRRFTVRRLARETGTIQANAQQMLAQRLGKDKKPPRLFRAPVRPDLQGRLGCLDARRRLRNTTDTEQRADHRDDLPRRPASHDWTKRNRARRHNDGFQNATAIADEIDGDAAINAHAAVSSLSSKPNSQRRVSPTG
ncbi:hypothetical protein AJ88_24985 [Mesorhizobium amorphae CCBAU 01583]|nr:hypothetical protein AJ88_24985 [Mesorhizobium amorphae CCBAU 01583]